MISRDKAQQLARSSGWLAGQPPQFQDDVLSRCHLRSFRERETIVHMGEEASGIYCLVAGAVRVEFPAPGGDYKIVTLKQPIFWFGQGSSLTRRARPITTTAASQVNVLHLTLPDFEQLIEDAAYCRAFTLLNLEHFNEAMQMLSHLLVNDVERRVALRLALLADRADKKLPASVPVTQADLAEMCGLSRPTVQQILSSFEERGLIRAGYRRIEIIDADGLVAHGENLASDYTPVPSV
jgi:CRP/FNR family cyclic AMP-dependent transcriptional regulator